MIFPEGTRRAPQAPSRATSSAWRISAAEIGVPCIPVALNSGLYWPRRHCSALSRHHRGGIPAADPRRASTRRAFFRRLQDDIETATARLIAEGEAELKRLGVS